MKVGLIADTHGLLRPEAVEALRGCDQLVHAGDIGKPQILEALRELAPLHVVRGNNDLGLAWADELPDSLLIPFGEWSLYLTHQIDHVPDPLPDSVRVVVTGHSHKPLIQTDGQVLFVNPGSAGPRRFRLPVSVALLEAAPEGPEVRLLTLG